MRQQTTTNPKCVFCLGFFFVATTFNYCCSLIAADVAKLPELVREPINQASCAKTPWLVLPQTRMACESY